MTMVLKHFFPPRFFISIAYLIVVACAELLMTYEARYGIALHALILFALLIHSSLDLLQNNIPRKKELHLFQSSLPIQQHFK